MLETLLFACLAPDAVWAHSPHDEILALQFAPRLAAGLILFAIVRFNLVYSINRGLTWVRLTRGLAGLPLVDVAASPAFDRDHTLLTVSKSHGVRRSTDGGISWTAPAKPPVETRLASVHLSPAFEVDGTAFILDQRGGLWGSRDRGETWETVSTENVAVTCLAFPEKAILAGTATGLVLRSTDGGLGWRVACRLPGRAGVTALAALRTASHAGLIAIGSDRAGIIVQELAEGPLNAARPALPKRHLTSLAWARAHTRAPVLFATTWRHGVYRSDDLGQTWVERSAGLTTDPQADDPAFRAPHFRRICVSPEFASDDTAVVAGFDGLFVTTDGGKRWREHRSILPISRIVGVDIACGGDAPGSLAISTYGQGPCLSLDAGRTWRLGADGLGEARSFGIALSPDFSRDSSLFLASNWALYRSSDAGATWMRTALAARNREGRELAMRSVSALRGAGGLVLHRLGLAPYRLLRRWFHLARGALGVRLPLPGFGACVAVSPTFAQDGTLYLHTGDTIWKSSDGGRSLTRSLTAPGGRIRALAISPEHATDHTLFAAIDRTLQVTRDGGGRWQRLAQTAAGRIGAFALSPRFGVDHTAFLASGGQLLRSTDRGASWEELAALPAREATEIDAILPTPDAAQGGDILVHAAGLGLFRSFDGGRNLRALTGLPPHPETSFSHFEDFPDQAPLVRLSPNYDRDQTIIAASQEQLWISRDRGESWTSFCLPARYDAARPEIVYRGAWTSPVPQTLAHARCRHAVQAGASARLEFVGTGVRWIGEHGPAQGMAEIRIDDERVAQADQYAPTPQGPVLCFESAPLTPGPHRVEIAALIGPSPATRPPHLVLHAFEVTGGA
ncbi:MAG TPA: hypothetical protein VGD81_08615 [Opitutaceae bacterium]